MSTPPEGSSEDRINAQAIRSLFVARRALNLTQTELADRLGWPRHKIANIENGRTRPLFADMVAMCVALKIPLLALCVGTPEGVAMRAQQAERIGQYYANAAANGGLFTPFDQKKMATGDMFMEPALVAPHDSLEAEADYYGGTFTTRATEPEPDE